MKEPGLRPDDADPDPADPAALGWLVAGLAVATLGYLGRIPPWLFLPCALLGFWRMRIAAGAVAAPGLVQRLVLTLGALALLAATGHIGLGLDRAAPLFVLLLWVKLLELRNGGDLKRAGFLAHFLCLGPLLIDQGLPAFLLAATASMLLLVAVARQCGMVAVPVAPLHRPPAVPGSVARLLLQALPLALLLFLLVPRQSVAVAGVSAAARTGLSEVLDPGEIARLAKDGSVAFRVEFPQGRLPPPAERYWRGAVLLRCEGLTWRRPSERWREQGPAPLSPPHRPGSEYEQEITLLAAGNPWIYGLETVTDPPPRAQRLAGQVQLLPGLPGASATYRLRSDTRRSPADHGGLVRAWGLRLPEQLAPRVVDLAAELRRGVGSVPELVERTLAWFQQQGFRYTLEPGVMGGDAAETFLFERRRGFCGHYAGAFALLMRLAGVESRVVIGYRGGEFNPQGGFLVLRQSDAHAWAEVWDGAERRWLRVDPTEVLSDDAGRSASATADAEAEEAARRQQGLLAAAWRSLWQWRDYLESLWDRWAVGFDLEVQARLVAWLGLDGLGRFGSLIGLVVGAAVLLVAAAVTLRLPALRPPRARAERAWDRLNARLAERGLGRRPAEAPGDWGRRLAGLLPEPEAGRVAAGLAAWQRLRYAPAAEVEDLARLEAAARG